MKRGSAGHSGFWRLYGEAKRSARKREIEFNLSFDDWLILVMNNCYYCNKAPIKRVSSAKSKQQCYKWPEANGIDRVDNTKGYFQENCVPCCGQCNKAKHMDSKETFFEMVKRIYNKHLIK